MCDEKKTRAGFQFTVARLTLRLGVVLEAIRFWRRRRTYRRGMIVTRFIAPDIRRDVDVIDASRLADGIITARTCTWNVLYHLRNIQAKPGFSEPREIEIEQLWQWFGQSWGGVVPTSIDEGM